MYKLMLLAICAPLALCGCVTSEEMEAKVAANDSNECHSYGAATGTDAYFQCRMVKVQQRIQAQEQAQAQFNQGAQNLIAATSPPRPIYVVPNY
jgi:hypothetical protein